MKKTLTFLLSLVLAATVYTVPSPIGEKTLTTVNADYYPMACSGGQYEVSWVNNSGGFDKLSCHNDFYSARTKMENYGAEYVVRHSSSLSPTKIIAISSGVAYTYPQRSGTSTITMNTTASGLVDAVKEKRIGITIHRELATPITETYKGNGEGRVYARITGFEGYVNLSEIDLVPMKFIERGLPIYLGGNDRTAANEQPFQVTPKQSKFTVVQNGNYKELKYTAYSGYNSSIEFNMTVGLAADWMPTGTTYYSWNGYDFYSDRTYRNKVGTYYNYYQFLPLRSQTKLTGDQINGFLASLGYNAPPSTQEVDKLPRNETALYNKGQAFIDAQNEYGVNGLLVFAMACLESGYGRSSIALKKNNLFGWNAVDSNPFEDATTFTSIDSCISEHMAFNLRGYLDINDARFHGSHLGNKGSGFNVKYATDPYWGYKIAGIAYQADKYAAGNNGNLIDHNRYSVGLINEHGLDVKREPNSSSKTLYNTTYGNNYQQNFTVVIRSQDSNWTELQATNGVRSNGTLVTHRKSGASTGGDLSPKEAYDWNLSKGYLPTGKITRLNSTVPIHNGLTPTGDAVQKVDSLGWKDNKLQITGQAYYPGIYVTNENKITVNLNVQSQFYEANMFALTTGVADKDKVSYSGEIDVTTLKAGTYYFVVESAYSKATDYPLRFYAPSSLALPEAKTIGNKKISFATVDNIMSMVIEDIVAEKPNPTPNPDTEKSIRNSITSVQYVDSSNIVNIKGQAFISGIDFKSDSDVKHEIILVDMISGKETSYLCTTTDADKPVNLYDGYIYQRINYEVNIDLGQLPENNYYFKQQITNGTTVMNGLLYYPRSSSLIEDKLTTSTGDDGKPIHNRQRIAQNPLYNYRVEFSRENSEIDTSVIKKASLRTSGFESSSFKIESGHLMIDGVAWMYNVNHSKDDQVVHKIILVDEKGHKSEFGSDNGVKTKACSIDYSKFLGKDYNFDNICFDADIDLTKLSTGNYRVYLDVSTKTNRDIYELNDIYNKFKTEESFENRKYDIGATKVRTRVELNISDEQVIYESEALDEKELETFKVDVNTLTEAIENDELNFEEEIEESANEPTAAPVTQEKE